MIINAGNLTTLYTGYQTAFQAGFSGVTPQYGRVAMTVPSTTRTEEYGWLGQFPRIREWIGERAVQSLSVDDYRIKNKKFESTVEVDKDDIDDDRIGIYTPMMTELGSSAAQFPDELTWALLKAGFATNCYDGQYFFDTDHPVLDANGAAQSVSNTGGGSGTPWYLLDTTRTIKPLIFQNRRSFEFKRMDSPTDEVVFSQDKYRYGVDGRCNVGYGFWQLAYGSKQTLDAAAYATARAGMMGLLGDYGRPLGIKPNLLVVPPSLEKAGLQILNADKDAAGATNVWAGTAELLVVPWLA